MSLAGKSQRAGHHDVGVSDTVAEPIGCHNACAFLFQHLQHARYLSLAALDPEFQLVLAQHALIDEADRLVGEPASQRADFQCVPPRLAARRDHRFLRPDQFIQIIQDRRALDQRLATIEHQRRHPPQRIERRDLVSLAEGRPRPVLERQTIKPQRNRHAANKGGVVLADQDHALAQVSLSENNEALCSESPLRQIGTLGCIVQPSLAKIASCRN